ncbi:UDP-glucose 4-epimerase uge1 [Portunus trituberculatus]|uniref:UDP-glucose 4-epimerase uge1 n=1 Tax=Portunus trituberculatus TaxID=210409 RepID=A0A5B7G0X0_PORTR|nr:UDP-glucose 4-epimerase uge1 [Portunus trituberculatus]
MSKQKTVFVTGGTGYIGSHCIVDLLNEGYEVITIDNLTNSRSGALRRVEEITGKKVTFYECDLLDGETVHKIFAKHKIDYVIHFAAMKAVGESMQFPLIYYKNNVIGTINLIEVSIFVILQALRGIAQFFLVTGCKTQGRFSTFTQQK